MKTTFFLFFIFSLSVIAQGQITTSASLKKEDVANLILAINQQPHSAQEFENKEAAIKIAADIENPDTRIIEALIDNVSYIAKSAHGPVPFDPMNSPKYSFMPAYDALKTIGKPIIPDLLKKMKLCDDKILMAKYISLLIEIAGKDQGAVLINKAMAALPDGSQKEHLKNSLEFLYQ
jgi:hypothetical protein